ncbi:MAG: type II toxin-antitoxin system Phd/YefM family antitoxin [Muribaculaceae bacterium]|nr:type II toxin-antitoxin system Phd/YefM family antitoxin [Muribaculaceae bacterium]
MKTANYTELRKNLSAYLDAVIDDSETVIINREGNDAVVMISLEEYNAIKETAYLMQSPSMMMAIRKGIEDAQTGRTVIQNTDESIEAFLNRI